MASLSCSNYFLLTDLLRSSRNSVGVSARVNSELNPSSIIVPVGPAATPSPTDHRVGSSSAFLDTSSKLQSDLAHTFPGFRRRTDDGEISVLQRIRGNRPTFLRQPCWRRVESRSRATSANIGCHRYSIAPITSDDVTDLNCNVKRCKQHKIIMRYLLSKVKSQAQGPSRSPSYLLADDVAYPTISIFLQPPRRRKTKIKMSPAYSSYVPTFTRLRRRISSEVCMMMMMLPEDAVLRLSM